MKVCEIENIKIISCNQRLIPAHGRLINNPDYTRYRDLIASYSIPVFVKPDYRVTIRVDEYVDIDNGLKAIFDGLQKRGVIDNDRNIIELHVYKNKIPRGKAGKIIVEVEMV